MLSTKPIIQTDDDLLIRPKGIKLSWSWMKIIALFMTKASAWVSRPATLSENQQFFIHFFNIPGVNIYNMIRTSKFLPKLWTLENWDIYFQ